MSVLRGDGKPKGNGITSKPRGRDNRLIRDFGGLLDRLDTIRLPSQATAALFPQILASFRHTSLEAVQKRKRTGATLAAEMDCVVCEVVTSLQNDLPPQLQGNFAVIAVGSYGRREMTSNSDIDLLLVHNGNRAVQTFAKFGKKLDFALRQYDADGRVGVKVCDITNTCEFCFSVEEYKTIIARGFYAFSGQEFLPLTEKRSISAIIFADARFIAGNSELGEQFCALGLSVPQEKPDLHSTETSLELLDPTVGFGRVRLDFLNTISDMFLWFRKKYEINSSSRFDILQGLNGKGLVSDEGLDKLATAYAILLNYKERTQPDLYAHATPSKNSPEYESIVLWVSFIRFCLQESE